MIILDMGIWWIESHTIASVSVASGGRTGTDQTLDRAGMIIAGVVSLAQGGSGGTMENCRISLSNPASINPFTPPIYGTTIRSNRYNDDPVDSHSFGGTMILFMRKSGI